jgi:hypothetical protein
VVEHKTEPLDQVDQVVVEQDLVRVMEQQELPIQEVVEVEVDQEELYHHLMVVPADQV